MAKVKALRDFRSGTIGSRTKGDRFEYDIDKDPADLVKLGLVEVLDKPAAETGKAK